MDIGVKLVDWGPKAKANVDTYIFLFRKQTDFSLHNRATSTSRQELPLRDGSAGQCASSGLAKTHRNLGSSPTYNSRSQKSVQTQRGMLNCIETTNLTFSVIWCGAFLSPVHLLKKTIMHRPGNCYMVLFEHIKTLQVIQQTLLWSRPTCLTQYLCEEERNYVIKIKSSLFNMYIYSFIHPTYHSLNISANK